VEERATIDRALGILVSAGLLCEVAADLREEVRLTPTGLRVSADRTFARLRAHLIPGREMSAEELDLLFRDLELDWSTTMLVSLNLLRLTARGRFAVPGSLAEHLEVVERAVARLARRAASPASHLPADELRAIRQHGQLRGARAGALFRIRRRRVPRYAVVSRSQRPHVWNVRLPMPPEVTVGARHPYRQFLVECCEYLRGLGFAEFDRPSVTTRRLNADLLGLHEHHRALEESSTLRVRGRYTGGVAVEAPDALVLRGHACATSAGFLEQFRPSAGCYFTLATCYSGRRPDRHYSSEFVMLETLLVGPDAVLGHLLWLLRDFATKFADGRDGVRFVSTSYPSTSVAVRVATPRSPADHLGGGGLLREDLAKGLGIGTPVVMAWLGVNAAAECRLAARGHHELVASRAQAPSGLVAPA
jgi:phenylalanyl-tRNA synthetase alpha subunit